MEEWITIKVKLDTNKNEVSRFKLNETTTDSNGNVLDESEYNDDGSVSCKRIYRYFDDGTIKEYVEYDPMNELIERHVYFKNQADETEKVIYEYGDGRKVIRQFSYSELGLADIATLYDENDSVLGYETYVFNEHGDVIERIDSDGENTETVKYSNDYDENGNPVEERKFIEGELTEVLSYQYDPDENLIRKELRNIKDNYQVVDEYKYDLHGNMLLNTSFQNGVLVFENKCTYDPDGRLLTEEFFEVDFWEKKVLRHEKLLHRPRS